MLSIHDIVAETGACKELSYLRVYERLFEPLRDKPLALLELGVKEARSVRAWEAYFPNARIAGLDRKLPKCSLSERVRLFEGDQADINLLARAAAEVAPNGFDIIIDDCAHVGSAAKASFWYLFDNHLNPGGCDEKDKRNCSNSSGSSSAVRSAYIASSSPRQRLVIVCGQGASLLWPLPQSS